MKRKTSVAGQFYPSSKQEISKFLAKLIPETKEKLDVLSAVVPHAGWMYSGYVAGAVYSIITPPDTFLIFGPNHHGAGAEISIWSKGSWEIPHDEIEIDSQFAEEILSATELVQEDNIAHSYEHSIEVQLPFIKQIAPNSKIVPIAITDYSKNTIKKLGEDIAKCKSFKNKNIVILASSDFTHYEPQKKAVENDNLAIEKILKMDFDGFFDTVQKKRISLCGLGPIGTMITITKNLGYKETKLIKYQTSGDITGDYYQVVGYAGIITTK